MQEKDYSIFDGQCLSQNGPILTTAIVCRIRFQHLQWPLFISKCSNFSTVILRHKRFQNSRWLLCIAKDIWSPNSLVSNSISDETYLVFTMAVCHRNKIFSDGSSVIQLSGLDFFRRRSTAICRCKKILTTTFHILPTNIGHR